MERRTALKTISLAAAAPTAVLGMMQTMITSAYAAAESESAAPLPLDNRPPETTRGEMRYRKLGRTGEEVSLIGVGGYHIGSVKDESEAIKIIRSAIDRGVTFMDNCWDYHDGESERRMGKALKDGYREKVFLMTKIDGRTKKAAVEQIDESLKRLGTDHVDLIQHHENIRMEDADRIFADGGAREAFDEAKQAGKIRFVGFTGHKDPQVHLRMLEVARDHDYHFDTAQMPLNLMDAHFRSFARHVVPECVKAEIAVLGMKSMGSGDMTLPTSVVITGIDSMAILDQAFEAVKTFQPLTADQIAAFMEQTRQAAVTGKFERFKTTPVYDSTATNPKWLG
jgi:predicted aldo/keto reductase-like oxidoreductase